jgi:chlorite dismutase
LIKNLEDKVQKGKGFLLSKDNDYIRLNEMRRFYESLDQEEKRIVDNDIFLETYDPDWWICYYSKSTYFRKKEKVNQKIERWTNEHS